MKFYGQRKEKGQEIQNPNNVKDLYGLTALHYAAKFNKFEIMAYLLTEEPGVSVSLFVSVSSTVLWILLSSYQTYSKCFSFHEYHLTNYITAAEPQIFPSELKIHAEPKFCGILYVGLHT